MPTLITERNRRAIDLYLSGKEKFRGNGTACWQEIYGTKNKKTASAAWARMLGNVSAQKYLEDRRREVDAERAKLIAYEQADAMCDLLMIKEDAMAKGEDGQMADRRVAMTATVELLKVQGKYDNRPAHTGKDDSVIQLVITETEAKL